MTSSFQSFNPYTQQVLKTFPALTPEQINQKIAKAQEAFTSWKKTSFEERKQLMHRAAEELEQNKEHYATLITQEMGKVMKESIAEIEKCAFCCRQYADDAEKMLAPVEIPTDSAKSYVRYEPLGIIFAVMPWNFPFWQVLRFACPTLMAGNVGLLKHAANVPQCAQTIEEVFTKVGFPVGVFQNLFIDHDASEQVIGHPAVKAVTLTGSSRAGTAIAKLAGAHLKKSVLELGGSDPFVVLKDAPLQTVAQKAVTARMLNTGQSCIASKRFIIEEAIFEPFLEEMKKAFAHLKTGDPMDQATHYACMARNDLASTLYDQVKKSVEMGAKIIIGGKAPQDAFFEPTILTNLHKGMPAYDEELFGPVASLISVPNEQEAIRVANDTFFGLGATIWTADEDKGESLAHEIEAGLVFINSILRSDPRLPFGGIKGSGYGRELASWGIHEFMNVKTVLIRHLEGHPLN